jgi:hypothetical protein
MHQITDGYCHCVLSQRLVLFVIMAHSLSALDVENAVNRFGHRMFVVRADDADRNSARRPANHAPIRRVAFFLEFDAE